MATAMEEALIRAEQARQAKLNSAVKSWSSDDTVHSDPPLPTAPDEHPAQEAAPQQENHVAQDFQASKSTETLADQRPPERLTFGSFTVPNPALYGVTEAIQIATRENPGAVRRELMRAMEEAGYKLVSLSSLFGTMVTQGIIKAEDGRVWAKYKRFRPLKSQQVWIDHVNAQRALKAGATAAVIDKKAARDGSSIKPRGDSYDTTRYASMVRWARVKGVKNVPSWEEWSKGVSKGSGAPKKGDKKALDKAHRDAKQHKPVVGSRTLDKAVGRTDPTRPAYEPRLDALTPTQVVRGLGAMQAFEVYKLLREMFKN